MSEPAETIGRGTQRQLDLRAIVEKIEGFRAIKAQCSEDEKTTLQAAKAAGFFPAIIKLMVKMRTLTEDERTEYETRRTLYMHAMELNSADDAEAFKIVEALAADEMGRAELVSQFKGLVPRNGSVTLVLQGKGVRIWRDADGISHHTEVTVQEQDDNVVHIGKPH